jgi:hypothetical protein
LYVFFFFFFKKAGGYHDLVSVSEMDETDLNLIGISDSKHRQVLMEEIKRLKDSSELHHSKSSIQ